MPLVASQETTCVVHDDVDVNLSYLNESLRKIKFVVHIILSAGEADDIQSCTVLICKGSPRGRRAKIEKLAWSQRVSMIFQKSA